MSVPCFRSENDGALSSYWLAHSEGFEVDGPGGRIGTVESVIFRTPEEPYALIVRAGLFVRTLLVIPARDVAEVEPRRKRVVLQASAEVGNGDFLSELSPRLDEEQVPVETREPTVRSRRPQASPPVGAISP